MSTLIDDLIKQEHTYCSFLDDRYFIAKPYRLFGIIGFMQRLKDAYRVLIDKSRAYHYMQDVRR